MWLIPCSRRWFSVRSASALETSPSAAAPKITRLDSCPVAPNGARSIMARRLPVMLDRQLEAIRELRGGLARAGMERALEGHRRLRAAVESPALGHDKRRALDVDRDDGRPGGERELGDARAVALGAGAAGALR